MEKTDWKEVTINDINKWLVVARKFKIIEGEKEEDTQKRFFEQYKKIFIQKKFKPWKNYAENIEE